MMTQQRQRGVPIPRLQAWRIFRNLTCAQLAGLIGVNATVISRVENGGRCEWATVQRIAAVLALKVEQLLLESPYRDDIAPMGDPLSEDEEDIMRVLDEQLTKLTPKARKKTPERPPTTLEELLAEADRQAVKYGFSPN